MKQQVLILAFVSTVAFVPAAAGQSCLQKCLDISSVNTSETFDHRRELCQISCRGVTDPPQYGAIAYSKRDKLWGFTYNQSNKATAESLALQYCVKQGGAKCVIEASFHNICGAVAADGDIVTWGVAGSKLSAQQYAEAACARVGGKKCESQASICSNPSTNGASDLRSAPLPPRSVSWAAIAYSNGDNGAGWSQGKDDRATAEREAMTACAQRGKSCVLKTTFNKQCGALAADRDFSGWATSADQREAQQKAMDECRKSGGTRCVLHISFCSQ